MFIHLMQDVKREAISLSTLFSNFLDKMYMYKKQPDGSFINFSHDTD